MPFRFGALPRILLSTFASLTAGLSLAGPVAAETFLLGDEGALHRFDLATESFEFLGDSELSLASIAFDPSGRLFAAAESGLYRLDTVDASPTLVGSWSETLAVDALAFDPGAGLFLAASGSLYSVDPTTAQRTFLSTPNPRVQGLAAADGRLLALGVLGEAWALYEVDRATGALTQLVDLPLFAPQDAANYTLVSMDVDAQGTGLNLFVANSIAIGLPPLATLALDHLDLATGTLEAGPSFTVSASIPFASGSATRPIVADRVVEVPTLRHAGVLTFALLLSAVAFAMLGRRFR